METVSWKERAEHVLAQGHTGTNSKRATAYVDGVFPSHIVRGESCYLYDINGRRFIDFVSALGTNILGYSHPRVQEAVKKQLDRGGPSYTFPSFIEVETSERITELIPSCQKIRFMKNGDDSTTAAVRIARALQFIRGDRQ